MQLQGKAGVVTGGGSGIGRATCLLFASHGASLVVCDVDEGRAEETVRLVKEKSKGAHAVALKCDVTNPNEVEHAVDLCCATFDGRLDFMFANAGI